MVRVRVHSKEKDSFNTRILFLESCSPRVKLELGLRLLLDKNLEIELYEVELYGLSFI